ncbi:hypothetical protein KSD_77220 [Ktedonobacter sp. SOSP1-85]|uniref:protein-L-isoaspartate O-methyltransferase family protein n=1 Tax=Ktedonobacter sp. SOSP1-85 TaxID=2778367 RepID=UPI0019155142|nr:methyltransferase domain-containing protein [Ktedonobacter sp. SOSP1-85]GHO79951.1 hypothetical protein KSD_77220 [Ktedonobacter sp. SOSP1-85]
MNQQISIQYREQLVKNIEATLGHCLTPIVRDAFLSIPREAFVDQYYRQRGNELAWDTILDPSLKEIYQDHPLVTRLDARKMPSSSSSQPSVMTAQLEALALAPGQRVLEIGAGTGYNAALMGYMVEQVGMVVSVDIAEDLIQHAAERLKHVGITNVHAFTADGYRGYAEYAPYDRLLATCGVPAIPPLWLQQLREGGIFIANVLLPLASIFVRVEKVGDIGIGKLLPIQASYMRLTGPNSADPFPRFHWKQLSTLPKQTLQLGEDLEALLEHSSGFAILLQSYCPTLTKRYRRQHDQQEGRFDLYLLSQPQQETIIHVHNDCLTIYGQAELIVSSIQACLQAYHDLGKPRIEDYAFSLSETSMVINRKGRDFPLLPEHEQASSSLK